MTTFLENNKELLEDIKNGKISNIEGSVGSFLMCLFDGKNFDCIPLFFEFLSYKTGKDYSVEIEWVLECIKEGKKSFELLDKLFENAEENPMGLIALLMAMSD